jgi:hypothetical protein
MFLWKKMLQERLPSLKMKKTYVVEGWRKLVTKGNTWLFLAGMWIAVR